MNDDTSDRELIAFGRRIDWETEAPEGTVRFGPETSRDFDSISTTTVNRLLEFGYLDPTNRHNDAPTVEELLEFLRMIQVEYGNEVQVGLSGFMTAPDREDSRIRLDGFVIFGDTGLPSGVQGAVHRRFSPDGISVTDTYLYFWWD